MQRALLLWSFCATPVLAQTAEPIPAAFASAGDNRGELERAWREVPKEHRASLQFLLDHMAESDARTLKAAFLLREVEQAHRAREVVRWGAGLPDELFSNYVLPYAQANEAREDW